MNFIWIDDLPERIEASKNLAESLNVDVQFIDVKGKNLIDELAKMIEGEEPNLIIIDHNLEDSDSGVFKKGSSAAASIRESWPECPIICVSAVDIAEVDSQQKALYEDIISIEKISNHYNKIYSIADSYNFIKTHRPTNDTELLKLLGTPELDAFRLEAILPTHRYQDSSLTVEISKWVRKTLIDRPGFLYDKLWLCTMIGIKVESFEKIAEIFEDAAYNGIFCNPDNKRWWKSKAQAILYANSELSGLPWERGRGLKGIQTEDYSRSYATDKEFPETVAFVDSSADAIQVPIKIRESDIHPDYESLLYFEEIRIMKPAE